jgi:hypothetical protein
VGSSLRIRLQFGRLTMCTAVNLYNELVLAAHEVGEVWSDRLLAHKLESAELPVAKTTPQGSLGRNMIGAENARSVRLPRLTATH